jgi:DNA polymerase-3 subunit epsilon/ATP-dependent DNA helicase DinG
LEAHWAEARSHLEAVHRSVAPVLEDLADAAASGADLMSDVHADLLAAVRQIEDATIEADSIIMHPSPDTVSWVTAGGSPGFPDQGPTMHLAPLEVANQLRTWLLNAKASIVFTSATLTTNDSFDYVRQRLGADDARELALGSPFDYANAALLVLPTDVPEPNQTGYARRVAEAAAEMAVALGGRTLVLLTSYAQLRATYEHLQQPLQRAEIALMAQGIHGSRSRLLSRFKATERAVLLGTASFWEGVDVVGDALSALVIARLPFAVPTDPVFAARSEAYEDPFRQYAVPQAILRFKQGFGRLIRSKTDRGIIAVLDRRILTRSYGKAFLNSLPACTVRTAPLAALGPLAKAWVDRAPEAPDAQPTVPVATDSAFWSLRVVDGI